MPATLQGRIHRHLRRGGRRLRKNGAAGKPLIPNRVSIDECSFKDYGAAVGDWEMDTIVGKDGKGVILTLVEKKSSFLIMEKLKTGKKALPLANAVVRRLKETGLPVRMIVTDNGMEFAAHELIARELNTNVYFTHPYSSWEKGAVENINGLIRQYIPKKADFKGISRAWVEHVNRILNDMPRKKNGFKTPKEMISKINK